MTQWSIVENSKAMSISIEYVEIKNKTLSIIGN